MANPVSPGSAEVAANLADAADAQGLVPREIANGSALTEEVHEGNAEHVVEPTALGFNTTGWVGIAALAVLLIMLWQKVPAMIGRMLDGRIADIRRQLDEASALRAEAEALRAEYERKGRDAEADAATMREHAHHEAHQIVAEAKAAAEALMDRRARMAEDKIAAAERAAIAEVRARAAEVAAKAAATIIAERHDAGADRAMVDRTISGLARLN